MGDADTQIETGGAVDWKRTIGHSEIETRFRRKARIVTNALGLDMEVEVDG